MNACTKCKTKFNGSKCSKCKSSSHVKLNVSSYDYSSFNSISDYMGSSGSPDYGSSSGSDGGCGSE